MTSSVFRKALLIGCPGKDRHFLSAVEFDLLNMKNFLLSNRGGRWFNNEIEVLDNPTCNTLFSKIKKAISDYTFIYFSGHGWTHKDGRRMVNLQDDALCDLEFLNESPRQLTIIDACRKIPSHAISGIPETEPRFYRADGYYPARELYNSYILNSPVGKTIIHSTNHDTFSYAAPTGSQFTDALIKMAKLVKTSNYYPVSIPEILSLTTSELEKREETQRPTIAYEEGQMNIPFSFGFIQPVQALRKNHNSNIAKKNLPPNKTVSNNQLAVLGLAILIALSLD